jgi:hypothetical protein
MPGPLGHRIVQVVVITPVCIPQSVYKGVPAPPIYLSLSQESYIAEAGTSTTVVIRLR